MAPLQQGSQRPPAQLHQLLVRLVQVSQQQLHLLQLRHQPAEAGCVRVQRRFQVERLLT